MVERRVFLGTVASYGLSFRGKKAVFPFSFGRVLLCPPLRVSSFSKLKRSKVETRSNREYRPKTVKHKGPLNIRERPFYGLETGASLPARQRLNALWLLPANVRENSSSVRQLFAFTAAREGHSFRPLPLMQRDAGAKAIPDARRADGAPQQARTSPRPQAGEGSRRCPTRHAADGVQSNSRDNFRVTAKRGVRGCRGCRGAAAPLTPLPRAGQATRRPAEMLRRKWMRSVNTSVFYILYQNFLDLF